MKKPFLSRHDRPLVAVNLAVSGLVAYAHINLEAQRKLQLKISRVLANAPAGISTAQKQLALIILLEKLTALMPSGQQAENFVAVISTLLLGPRLLSAISGKAVEDPEGLH